MSKGFSYHYSGTKGHIVSVASSLPSNPLELVKSGWEDISHPKAAASGHYELKEISTGLRIRFDEKVFGVSGFKGKDHYNIHNPTATGNHIILEAKIDADILIINLLDDFNDEYYTISIKADKVAVKKI